MHLRTKDGQDNWGPEHDPRAKGRSTEKRGRKRKIYPRETSGTGGSGMLRGVKKKGGNLGKPYQESPKKVRIREV